MTNLEHRIEVATLLRELGHDFVSREMSDEELELLSGEVHGLLDRVGRAPMRERKVASGALERFSMSIPAEGQVEKHQLFSDSVVSGGANPMGLGALLWREGDTAVMEVTLGRAFEGAPGRSHGGVVAALIDETMGLAMGIQGALAFTAQLNIAFRAPTPIDEPIIARAWLDERQGRKLQIKASVTSGDTVVAEADALFIAVDPQRFLENLVDS